MNIGSQTSCNAVLQFAFWGLFLGAMTLLSGLASAQDDSKTPALNPEAVRKAINKGVGYLKEKQLADGSWTQLVYPGDTTAICILALLNSVDDFNDPAIQRGIGYLLTIPRNDKLRNYVVSLRIMILATIDPNGERYRKELAEDVKFLLANQFDEGTEKGGWAYDRRVSQFGIADASNSQFALLALHEASRLGIKIPRKHWELALAYWKKCNDVRSGGFGYRVNDQQATGSMTCAGISSILIIEENLIDAKNEFDGDRALCCNAKVENDLIEKAIKWLVANFSVRHNPAGQGRGNANQLYYLYGMERAGRLSGRRFFGPHDWYRAGGMALLTAQDRNGYFSSSGGHGETNLDVGTSLALLFLAKGKRPIAIGKYQFSEGNEWDLHPTGVHFLTARLEKAWSQKLNWQTVSGTNGTVNDLLEAPVLFISGKDQLKLDQQQKEALKSYLENGGFLFAEGCQGEGCGDGNFDEDFRRLMKEFFPESDLEPLETGHPIWNAHFPLLPNKERPMLGLRACCRTSVVYCPTNLSCYWALDRPAIRDVANDGLTARIEYCAQLGVNVVTYATGRNVKDKGETPKVNEKTVATLNDRVLEFPKLMHEGGSDEAPNALRILLKDLQGLGLRIKLEKKLLSASDDTVFDYPCVFVHGRNSFRWNDAERALLKTYLENGGIIFADSICTSNSFSQSFRNEIKAITGSNLKPLDASHDIWNERYGSRIEQVTLRKKNQNQQGGYLSSLTQPQLEGLEINGRLAVIFSPNDISCALENATFSQCDGLIHQDALRLGKKIIFYCLLSDRKSK